MAVESNIRPARVGRRLWQSPILRKVVTGVTGLLLIVYVFQHLYANLQIFSGDPQAVSKYGLKLQGFGVLLTLVELGLAVVIVYHAVMGIAIWLKKRGARSIRYKKYRTKGAPSKQTFASRTMIWGGFVLLAFLVIHVSYFRFGPGVAEGYGTQIDGETVRHYERLVTERFQHAGYVVFYTIAMGVLGVHLSHGFWSAVQSMGWVTDRNRDALYRLGVVLGAVVAMGFIAIPIRMYFGL